MPVGDPVIPWENVYAMWRDGGVFVQYGSGKNDRITMATGGTQINNMIRFHEKYFTILGLDGKPAQWVVDVRKGNATQGTGAVGIIRPRFPEWGYVGHLSVNVDLLSEAKAQELLIVSASRRGHCSGRPANKMPFGQAVLTHFKWLSGADPKKSIVRSNGAGAKPTAKRGRKKAGDDGAPVNRLEEVNNGETDGNGESEE